MVSIYEIFYPHVIAVMNRNVDDFDPYCSNYKSNSIVKTSEFSIISMLDMKDWYVPKLFKNEEVLLPKYTWLPGRSNKGRCKKLSVSFASSSNCCSRCSRAGHNRCICDFSTKETWKLHFFIHIRNQWYWLVLFIFISLNSFEFSINSFIMM